jgi:hypothetical protein
MSGAIAKDQCLSVDERALLERIEQDFPDSIGLLERIVAPVLARYPQARDDLLLVVRAGLTAYRDALDAGEDEPQRFGAFVDALAEALPRRAQFVVARALSRYQRDTLARRVPPNPASPPARADDAG